MFVPAVIEPAVSLVTRAPAASTSAVATFVQTGVELEIDGVAVKIAQDADADTISPVIAALRATR